MINEYYLSFFFFFPLWDYLFVAYEIIKRVAMEDDYHFNYFAYEVTYKTKKIYIRWCLNWLNQANNNIKIIFYGEE